MTQPAQGPPTIPKSEEISPMSGPETTATVEEDEIIDSDEEKQVHTTAGTTRKWRAFIADLFVLLWYRLDSRRQRNSRKREMIYFVVASGTKGCKVIGTGWLDFRREETHHLHLHDLQPPMAKDIHP